MIGNRPEVIKVFPIEVAIWERQGKTKNFYTVSIQRIYKDNGDWKRTTSINVNDIPKAIFALQKAYETVLKK